MYEGAPVGAGAELFPQALATPTAAARAMKVFIVIFVIWILARVLELNVLMVL